MRLSYSAVALTLVLSQAALAAPILNGPMAIIDSGTDFRHPMLVGAAWNNPGEIPNNGKDDDNNSKPDDMLGWDFTSKSPNVIDYSHLGTFSKDPYRFFEIQLKAFMGTITDEERAWIMEKRKDPNFIKEMGRFGNFVHGTHVAGIATRQVTNKAMAMKIIPTPARARFARELRYVNGFLANRLQKGQNPGDIAKDLIIKEILSKLADGQARMLEPMGLYAYTSQVRIANGSFGVSVRAIAPLITMIISKVLMREPTEEEVMKYGSFLVGQMLAKGRQFAVDAKDTMFVFAAGNDGTNNDILPTYPAGIRRRNTITVAAAFGSDRLAPFSNYGATTVDLAAPGVGIVSAIPGNETLAVSGTSQAAPFVTNVVEKMMETNPKLQFEGLKAVLMGTVDKKPALADKVVSGGLCNPRRAVYAAELTKTMSIPDAIARAMSEVGEAKVGVRNNGGILLPLPSLFQ